MISSQQLLVRILLAGVLGGLVGLDRELREQPAGLRTHILVSLGAALFTLAGAYGFGRPALGVPVDPTRVAAQVVTGIGFLGAGAILRQGVNVRGLTTAAGLWVTAAIGVAVAYGFWMPAFATTVVAVVALFGLKPVERRMLRRLMRGRSQYDLEIRTEFSIFEASRVLEAKGCKIDTLVMESSGEGPRRLSIQVRIPAGITAQEIADELSAVDGVVSIDWEGS